MRSLYLLSILKINNGLGIWKSDGKSREIMLMDGL
jgi:hypothetical protein